MMMSSMSRTQGRRVVGGGSRIRSRSIQSQSDEVIDYIVFA